MKLRSYDKDCKWIVDEDGQLLATIEALSNGKWFIVRHGKNVPGIHDSPRAAFKHFKELVA